MRLLKREILEGILLRRTKVQCADVLMLPPRYDPSCLAGYSNESGDRGLAHEGPQLPFTTSSQGEYELLALTIDISARGSFLDLNVSGRQISRWCIDCLHFLAEQHRENLTQGRGMSQGCGFEKGSLQSG